MMDLSHLPWQAAGSILSMMGLGLSVALTKVGITGGGVATSALVALWGDSMAEGSSGGGGVDAYNSLGPTLARYFLGGDEAVTIYNRGVGGETSTQVKNRFLSRTVFCKRNVFWVGRNDPSNPSTVLANIAAMAADLREYEDFVVLSVHNFNDGSEASGSADFLSIKEINDGLAATYPTKYLDTRQALVDGHILAGSPSEDLNFSRDEPANFFTADGLHLNAIGCDWAARLIWAHWLERERATTRPLTNLVINGDFALGDISGWTTDGTITYPAGGVRVEGDGVNPWVALQQQVVASDATGKKFILLIDILDQSDFIAFKARAYTGGGTAYDAITPTSRRNGRNFALALTATDVALGLSFEFVNNASSYFAIDNVRLYEVG